jgi:adenylosuccinate synthase
MPVSVVVGGQFGSEGKGKVALEIVRRDPSVAAVVRVGGTNSGHTVGSGNNLFVLRQLPAACIDGDVRVVLPAGSYIDLDILKQEITRVSLLNSSIFISPMARVITEEHKQWERDAALGDSIGSTQSGTGGAVIAMTARRARNLPLQSVRAKDVRELSCYLTDTTDLMNDLLATNKRIVIEGTQGFGLSVLHSEFWPKATSRDTTAAAFVAEAGLSPRDVDDVTVVLRSFPIRVSGDSGELPHEITWEILAAEAGLPADHKEFTSVTRRVRRVGRFEPDIVKRAIRVNNPTRIVLNHVDYVDPEIRDLGLTQKSRSFVEWVESAIGRAVDWIGTAPDQLLIRHD